MKRIYGLLAVLTLALSACGTTPAPELGTGVDDIGAYTVVARSGDETLSAQGTSQKLPTRVLEVREYSNSRYRTVFRIAFPSYTKDGLLDASVGVGSGGRMGNFLSSGVDRKYGEAASFWTGYLTNHYEAKWRKRTGKRSGYPIIEKPLFHPYVNNTRYHHYMYKLTGNSAYRQERDRQLGIIKRHLLPNGGAFVWTHFVNELRNDRRSSMSWDYQPVGYTGSRCRFLPIWGSRAS